MSAVVAVREALATSERSLTTPEIAERTGLDVREVDGILWGDPSAFVWQPGHRWSLLGPDDEVRFAGAGPVKDSRESPLVPRGGRELRAVTMASGLELRVTRRPMDSGAFFSVRSSGNRVELILNSSHEFLEEFPDLFEESSAKTEGIRAVEVLLEAWALYEDGLPGGSTRRGVEDIRLLWGRRVVEMLREGA